MDHTSEKWAMHVEQLKKFSVIEEIPYALVISCSKYFGVPKGPGIARAIWNGKKFSHLLQPPPPVNLVFLTNVLRKIQSLVDGDKGVYIIRHQFD